MCSDSPIYLLLMLKLESIVGPPPHVCRDMLKAWYSHSLTTAVKKNNSQIMVFCCFHLKKTPTHVFCVISSQWRKRFGALFGNSKCTNFISTCAYYQTVMAAAPCCPEVSLHPGPCWTLTWGPCWNGCSIFPVSLFTSEESNHYWLIGRAMYKFVSITAPQ